MFGFVTADLAGLTEQQRQRYKAYYCGLCRSLSERHGSLARFTLTYDMAFLVMVLSGLYEPYDLQGESPCPAHPFGKRAFLQSEISDYAADMNVALAYLNCLDDWNDEISVPALASAKALERAYEKVCAEYPRQCEVIKQSMAELKVIEDRRDTSTDAAAKAFGRLMAELFVMREDHWLSDNLSTSWMPASILKATKEHISITPSFTCTGGSMSRKGSGPSLSFCLPTASKALSGCR